MTKESIRLGIISKMQGRLQKDMKIVAMEQGRVEKKPHRLSRDESSITTHLCEKRSMSLGKRFRT